VEQGRFILGKAIGKVILRMGSPMVKGCITVMQQIKKLEVCGEMGR